MTDAVTCSSSEVAAIILAAGFSRRLGRPKQTVIIGSETLVERSVRVAMQASLSPVIVVVQPGADFIEPLRTRGCLIVENHEAAEGMASSIRRGVQTANMLKANGAVIMTCDQVAITAQHLQALTADPGRIAGSSYAGRIGIPAYFPSETFTALTALHGDVGARDLLRGERVVANENLALDIDTEADIASATSFTQRPSNPTEPAAETKTHHSSRRQPL